MMTVERLSPGHYPGFTEMLCTYFIRDLQSDIPEDILRGKLLELICRQSESGILHTDILIRRDTLLGFAIYQIDSPDSDWCKRPGWGFIREFYIGAPFRKMGYGTYLARHTEQRLHSLGAERLYLTSGNAIPFWERLGWVLTPDICTNDQQILEKQGENYGILDGTSSHRG